MQGNKFLLITRQLTVGEWKIDIYLQREKLSTNRNMKLIASLQK